MKYSVSLFRQADKAIHKFPTDTIKRIAAQIDELEENPRPSGCIKLQDTKDKYRVRVGDYRILYSIDDEQKSVLIHRIVLRREAYR
ncbi:MAG: type II toxin-antitoxin system RelE/ParE family toxin [Calditrichaeota bacterium]|nr:type II toxin-antitoxin system RelE/ParE family toxin [Calditrichota bacterium]